MKEITVEDLMVPLAEYATVSQEATLKEAVEVLEEAKDKFDNTRVRHRAVLVYNELNYIVGKISQLDILRALEPKYAQMGGSDPVSRYGLSRFGFSPKFMKSMMDQFELWGAPLEQLAKKNSDLKVKEFMYTPTEGEFVNKKASIDEAIHQLVLGHHQSLLVVSKKQIVGILRLTDLFMEICKVIKE